MKIIIEHCLVDENEILIRCPQIDDEILHVMALLKSHNQRLCAVDDKTFLYMAEVVHQVSLTLAELTSKYEVHYASLFKQQLGI